MDALGGWEVPSGELVLSSQSRGRAILVMEEETWLAELLSRLPYHPPLGAFSGTQGVWACFYFFFFFSLFLSSVSLFVPV